MKIKFIPFLENKNNQLLQPVPALNKLPDWYKSKKPFSGQDKKAKYHPDGTANITIKWCNPFGDALGAGYYILLENDISVTQENDGPSLVWHRGGSNFVSTHTKNQIDPNLIPEGYSEQPYKFKNSWGIKTPRGYSVIFTHPMNRPELPFLSLSGVVDTDKYNIPVNFPFIIKNNFEGIIESGTPIAQIIPFKRDSWTSEFENYSNENDEILESFSRTMYRPYKRKYWQRKYWK